MKEIKAYIREAMVDQVVDALGKLPGPPGVTVLDVQAYGHRPGGDTLERTRMAKLEVDVSDDSFDRVVDTVLKHARTQAGHPGDGKVLVSELAGAYRISDGAFGEQVLDG
ncbi:P-II family nitrogen regulator [Thiohalorhabdus sp.]|uniref:P-II family nitrogen regulator n=1 Tax=Thiohalorhabdus sp. TaxID=3094134 RepID=UPI002FC3DD26